MTRQPPGKGGDGVGAWLGPPGYWPPAPTLAHPSPAAGWRLLPSVHLASSQARGRCLWVGHRDSQRGQGANSTELGAQARTRGVMEEADHALLRGVEEGRGHGVVLAVRAEKLQGQETEQVVGRSSPARAAPDMATRHWGQLLPSNRGKTAPDPARPRLQRLDGPSAPGTRGNLPPHVASTPPHSTGKGLCPPSTAGLAPRTARPWPLEAWTRAGAPSTAAQVSPGPQAHTPPRQPPTCSCLWASLSWMLLSGRAAHRALSTCQSFSPLRAE